MCTIIQKYANTGLANVDTANANLDGSGTISLVLTATSGMNGTTIKSVTIKATGNTTEGMVRLFTYDGTNYYLWQEVYVPQITQTGVVEAFQSSIYSELVLDTGYQLYASTQNSESFNIFANGVDWVNCDCSDECNCTDMLTVANTGIVNIDSSNVHLDGSGSIGALLTAPVGTLVYGTSIGMIEIKATVTTQQGMVRIFINNGSQYYLIWEVPIPGCTQSNVEPAYRTRCFAAIDLQTGYAVGVSTQNANSFNVITFSSVLTNCSCQ